METLTIVLLIGAIFALLGTIYAFVKYNEKYNATKANPRFKSFVASAGQKATLSCPSGYVISLGSGSTNPHDKVIYTSTLNSSTNNSCGEVDVTQDFNQANGQNSWTSSFPIPSTQAWGGSAGGQLNCANPSGTFVYGQYECVLA